MTKKPKIFSGNLEGVPNKQIYLNINNLVAGTYTLKITQKNRVIKEITFQKK